VIVRRRAGSIAKRFRVPRESAWRSKQPRVAPIKPRAAASSREQPRAAPIKPRAAESSSDQAPSSREQPATAQNIDAPLKQSKITQNITNYKPPCPPMLLHHAPRDVLGQHFWTADAAQAGGTQSTACASVVHQGTKEAAAPDAHVRRISAAHRARSRQCDAALSIRRQRGAQPRVT